MDKVKNIKSILLLHVHICNYAHLVQVGHHHSCMRASLGWRSYDISRRRQ